MTPTRRGNEPNPGDNSPSSGAGVEPVGPADLPETEAESIGDFA